MDKKEKFIKLYIDGFEDDSLEYVDYFFEHCYNADNAMINHAETSALHIVYKQMFYQGKTIKLPYFVAVSTLKVKRGKGEIKELIRQALSRLKNEKLPFVGLYPFRHDYYTKYGFATIDKSVTIQNNPDIYKVSQSLTAKRIDEYLDDYYRLYTDFCKIFDVYFLRTKHDIAIKFKGMLMDNTEMIHYIKSNKIVGYQLYSEGQLEDVAGDNNCTLIELDNDNVQCRVVDIKVALEIYCYTCENCSFELNILDDILGNSVWQVCIQDGKATANQLEALSLECKTMTIAELTALLINGNNAKTYGLDQIFKTAKVYMADKY